MVKKKVTYRLRDWLFSRQRYWGEPIPIIHWEDGTSTAVPESELPLVLPVTKDIRPSGTGESPLANLTDWLEVTREDGVKGRRETNTCHNGQVQAGTTSAISIHTTLRNWLMRTFSNNGCQSISNVGGAEHAVLHLLYARFWHKFLYDLGVVPTKEPSKNSLIKG